MGIGRGVVGFAIAGSVTGHLSPSRNVAASFGSPFHPAGESERVQAGNSVGGASRAGPGPAGAQGAEAARCAGGYGPAATGGVHEAPADPLALGEGELTLQTEHRHPSELGLAGRETSMQARFVPEGSEGHPRHPGLLADYQPRALEPGREVEVLSVSSVTWAPSS